MRFSTMVLLVLCACLIVVTCTSCTLVGPVDAEAGIGAQIDGLPWNNGPGDPNHWMGKNPTGTLRVRQHFGDSPFFCELEHTSNILSGRPFNHDPETRLDQAACFTKFTLAQQH